MNSNFFQKYSFDKFYRSQILIPTLNGSADSLRALILHERLMLSTKQILGDGETPQLEEGTGAFYLEILQYQNMILNTFKRNFIVNASNLFLENHLLMFLTWNYNKSNIVPILKWLSVSENRHCWEVTRYRISVLFCRMFVAKSALLLCTIAYRYFIQWKSEEMPESQEKSRI